MPILAVVLFLFAIYILYKLFISGWLFKIPVFIAGWIGLMIILRAVGIHGVAFTLNNGTSIGWSFVISTFICLMALLTTRTED